VISGAGAAESPTALTVRREMQSWRLFQLEPSALRRPDEVRSPARLGSDGSHLAAALHRLAAALGEKRAYGAIAERLAGLADNARGVRVDHDEHRGLVTLRVIDREGTEHPASSISDGCLRFLALAVLELDPEETGLICMEEPENGVHPERIPAMLQLLTNLASDVERPVSADNPLRQVVVNTHSPAVVSQVTEGSLLLALAREDENDFQGRFQKVEFHPLPGTWRAEVPGSLEPVPFARLLAYLNPAVPQDFLSYPHRDRRRRRVVDRDDVRQLLIPFSEEP
jgi:predicted ATPase